LLQSLLSFFKGIRKQETEKTPIKSAPKDEPVKREPAQTASAQPRQQPAAQQPPAQAQPQQPEAQAQAPSSAPARPSPAQTAPVQPPAQAQPHQPAAQAENKPKKGLLQSLLSFFKGIRKQETEKNPIKSATKDEPVKKEPAQTASTQPRQQPAAQTPSSAPARPSPVQTAPAQPPAQAQPRQPAAQAPSSAPAKITPTQTPAPAKPGTGEKDRKIPPWILPLFILFLPLIAVIVFLFFVIRRKLEAIPARAVSYVAGRTIASPPRRDITVKPGVNPIIYLEVDYQNRNIGRRNTHSLKAGSTYTVGGRNSDFLIFLVPIPPAIGILKYDGKECVFIPKKLRYFPELSEPVPDCIEKTIRVISDSGHKLSFRFKQYEDPLLAINQIMNPRLS
jgi:hypothetical protein